MNRFNLQGMIICIHYNIGELSSSTTKAIYYKKAKKNYLFARQLKNNLEQYSMTEILRKNTLMFFINLTMWSVCDINLIHSVLENNT